MTTTYPNDPQFEDVALSKVTAEKGGGWFATRVDGWAFFIPKECPIEPKAEMVARLYGRGLGYPFRGLFIDGHKVFYRTEAEEHDHAEVQSYGADAADWLSRWDAGKGVWSIEMGGLGPGYEQAIQITAAEIVRHLLVSQYDASVWADSEKWDADREAISAAVSPIVDPLGLSGAQWGAALSLATKLYRDGPRAVLTNPAIAERKIQVSRDMPSLTKAA